MKPMTFRYLVILALVFVAIGFLGTVEIDSAKKSKNPIKTLYHVNSDSQASNAIRNINNHLKADSQAKIVVVTHNSGVDFLLQGAKDDKGALFADKVFDLQVKGVEFRVCNNTLNSRNIEKSKVIDEVKIVPSGVVEVAKLQALEGFVYLKP